MALLNLTNYDDHPTEPGWLVFRYADAEMAAEFLAGLEAAGIPHEVDRDEGTLVLVGVKQRHRDAAVRINYAVLGRHREPARRLAFAPARQHIAYQVGHLQLLSDPGVAHKLAQWLA